MCWWQSLCYDMGVQRDVSLVGIVAITRNQSCAARVPEKHVYLRVVVVLELCQEVLRLRGLRKDLAAESGLSCRLSVRAPTQASAWNFARLSVQAL